MSRDQRRPIAGPDPAELSEDDLLEAVGRLAALGRRVAGAPLSEDTIAELDGHRRFIAGLLHVGLQVLWNEGARRIDGDVAQLVAEVESWLEGGR